MARFLLLFYDACGNAEGGETDCLKPKSGCQPKSVIAVVVQVFNVYG